MDLRSYITMEVAKGDNQERKYVFLVPIGSPYAEANAVAQEFAAGILELERLNNEKAAAEKESAEPQEASNSQEN